MGRGYRNIYSTKTLKHVDISGNIKILSIFDQVGNHTEIDGILRGKSCISSEYVSLDVFKSHILYSTELEDLCELSGTTEII